MRSGTREREERRRLEKEHQERQCLEREQEQQRLAQERLQTGDGRTPFGSHTPLQDENGEDLDYIDDLDRKEQADETWRRLRADLLTNQQLA